jgi:hypothetical protein
MGDAMLAKSDWPEDAGERFWETYPRRIAKKAALFALQRVQRSGEVPFEVLISAVAVYARSVVGKDMKYVAHPATWINAGRWDDDPDALLNGRVQASAMTAAGRPEVFIEVGTDSYRAWAAVKSIGTGRRWNLQTDTMVEGRLRRGWWFVSEWPPNPVGAE